MPSTLFNVLFLMALFIPLAMYVVGVTVLMTAIVVKHFGARRKVSRPVEAMAH